MNITGSFSFSPQFHYPELSDLKIPLLPNSCINKLFVHLHFKRTTSYIRMQSYGVYSQSQSLLGDMSHTELNVVIHGQNDQLTLQVLGETFWSENLGPM